MRKVVLQLMTTLNGRVDDPEAWLPDIGDDLYREIDRVYSTFDTILVGQTTYEEMVADRPGAETDEGSSEPNRSMARKMNTYKKYVFSSGKAKKTLGWKNVEQVIVSRDEDIVGFVNDLKAQPGADIHLAGGVQLAQTMVRLGLVDEYHFFVYPVVSLGAPWFDGIDSNREMEFLSATPYENGVVGLYYKARDNATTNQ